MNEKERAAGNIRTAVAMYHSSQVLLEAFEKGIDGTKEERDRAMGSFLAANALAAFGIENALKALIRRKGGNPNKLKVKDRHNLKKLYDLYGKLDPDTQQRIQEKSVAIDIRVKGKVRRIRVEGVIDEHQDSFQEWRYRESGKSLPVLLGVLPGTLQAVIQTHDEKYREEIKREEKQSTGQASPGMVKRAIEYYENVLIPEAG